MTVVDERPPETLGNRGAEGGGAEITIAGHRIVTAVKDSVSQGLLQQTFIPVSRGQPSEKELRVEIRSVTYRFSSGLWSGKLTTEAALKGICIRNGVRIYEQFYRGSHEEPIQVIPDEEGNNRFVNLAISKAINYLLDDTMLLKCLAE